jgi:hypothetical protein
MFPMSEVSGQRRARMEFQPSEIREGHDAARTPTPHDPDGLELGMGALLRFKSMMAAEGHEVHLARMCYDRLYAYERFAQAHAGSDEALKRLALELFQIYHRRSAVGRVPQ